VVTGRTYLSIGEVLALLRDEFPDVTISKIRFLESQGLVDPERTPSGYRKFYDDDVARLRWVLRQQREHFLPLKVIKGRLEAGLVELDAGPAAPGPAAEPTASAPEGADDGGSAPGEVRAPSRSALEADGQSGEPEPHVRVDERAGSGIRPAAVATRSTPEVLRRRSAGRQAEPSGGHPSAGGRGAKDVSLPGFEQAGGAEPESAPPGRPRPVRSAGPGTGASPGAVAAAVPGLGWTAEELAGAAGLDRDEVDELVAFGLLGGRTVAGTTYFDDADVAIAEVAGAFARFGVEARHLRLHKHAAEREAGFIEQVVLPIVKQRNPEAHQRAAATARELAELGQRLRTQLVRRTLGDLLR
jgi:DNA-binding transcriptional MerR regulator